MGGALPYSPLTHNFYKCVRTLSPALALLRAHREGTGIMYTVSRQVSHRFKVLIEAD